MKRTFSIKYFFIELAISLLIASLFPILLNPLHSGLLQCSSAF